MSEMIEHQLRVLVELDEITKGLHNRHTTGQKLWMPSELRRESELSTKPDLPPEIMAMLVLNLLTEDGLPYFLSLITHHLGDKGAIWDWSRTWTAEENRHGDVIKHYVRSILTPKQMAEVERLEFDYLVNGFWPNWEKRPYRLLAYVVIQEMATQISHRNIAKLARNHDRFLAQILGHIAGEEKAHHDFYVGLFKAIISIDPSEALYDLESALRTFAMPGAGMPKFESLAYLQMRHQVFGPRELADIIDRVNKTLAVESLTNLSDVGKVAQENLCQMAERLRRVSVGRMRRKERTIPIPFLGDGVSVII